MNLPWRILPSCLGTIGFLLLFSCDNINYEDYLSSSKNGSDEGYNVTFHVENYDLTPFDNDTYPSSLSRASVAVSELGNSINLCVYQDGKKVKQVNQEASDSDFGTIGLSLSEGSYELVVLVNSCEGNATMTDLENIYWDSHKVTDTFYYYTVIDVTGDEAYNITVSRCVAMYRCIIEDEIPEEVAQMKFYYTGGSSTFSAITCFGSVNSRQTEYRDISSYEKGQTFELYTFPHDTSGELKMVVTALDGEGNTVKEVTYDDIPVQLNMITNHYTYFFTGGTGNGKQFSIQGNNAWDGELYY